MPVKRIILGLVSACFFALWLWLIYCFPDVRLWVVFLPIIFLINFSKSKRVQTVFIAGFVIVWTLLFHYESLRYFYLNPLFKQEFPKTKFLFPPAGWIMFFRVEDHFGRVEVRAEKDGAIRTIDPHDIFSTRTLGFDNIHRNIMTSVANTNLAKPFCRFLEAKFPDFEKFFIVGIYYPSLTQNPTLRYEQIKYQCLTDKGL